MITLSDYDTLELNTAGVSVVVDTMTEMSCEVLREVIEPLVLAESPAVFSIGKRVVHRKYDFIWKHGTLPYFRKPDGKKIMMEVIDDVPYIRTRKRITDRRQCTAALAVPTIPARTRRRQVAAPARPSHYSSDDEDDGGPPPLVDSSFEESGSDSSDNENESASSGTSDSVPVSGESEDKDATSEESSSSDSSIEIEDTFRKK